MKGTRGITYRPTPRGQLDVWQPMWGCGDGKRPVVVWLYGGYWQNGRRGQYRPIAFPFTSAGCIVVIPDYRLSPLVKFPTFVDDAAAAVAWAHRHAQEFGGDPNRIFLAGHSAGAYIAALLNLDERYLDQAGVPRGVLKGTIGLSGPYEFTPGGADMLRVFGADRTRWPETQPANFIDGNEPPMLLIQGGDDQLVDPTSARKLARAIHAKGGRATAVFYPDMSHFGTLMSLAWPVWPTTDIRERCVHFIRANE
jgi:acetyl esterase/lipase